MRTNRTCPSASENEIQNLGAELQNNLEQMEDNSGLYKLTFF